VGVRCAFSLATRFAPATRGTPHPSLPASIESVAGEPPAQDPLPHLLPGDPCDIGSLLDRRGNHFFNRCKGPGVSARDLSSTLGPSRLFCSSVLMHAWGDDRSRVSVPRAGARPCRVQILAGDEPRVLRGRHHLPAGAGVGGRWGASRLPVGRGSLPRLRAAEDSAPGTFCEGVAVTQPPDTGGRLQEGPFAPWRRPPAAHPCLWPRVNAANLSSRRHDVLPRALATAAPRCQRAFCDYWQRLATTAPILPVTSREIGGNWVARGPHKQSYRPSPTLPLSPDATRTEGSASGRCPTHLGLAPARLTHLAPGPNPPPLAVPPGCPYGPSGSLNPCRRQVWADSARIAPPSRRSGEVSQESDERQFGRPAPGIRR
jgi:hypothetical protein